LKFELLFSAEVQGIYMLVRTGFFGVGRHTQGLESYKVFLVKFQNSIWVFGIDFEVVDPSIPVFRGKAASWFVVIYE
jgi:hypothetical protein